MTNPYPQRNPFPYQGALSIEGTSLEEQDDWAVNHQPTLLRDSIQDLRSKAVKYIGRFRPNVQGQGQIVVLSGDHGSGKTHSIHYLMGEVANGRLLSDSESDTPRPLQLYAKAEGADFLKIYQQITSKIPLPLLRDLSLRFFGVLAGKQFGSERKNSQAGQVEAEKLRREPQKIFELFRQYRVEEGAVQELQIKEVERVAGGVDDFKRAFSYLLTEHLSSEAYNWLTGQPVNTINLRRLGVSGEIRSAEVAKWGLQLLTTIFNRAGHPLIIYIDQYEKLVLDPQAGLIGHNMGLLHSLAEVIPRENGMLVVSGNREAWAALARDLKQRFAFNIIEFSVLTTEEAQQLLYVYLRPNAEWDEHLPPAHLSDKDLYPFTSEAVLKIISYSGGNPRRLLQTCAEAFEEVSPSQAVIGTELVEKTVKKSPQVYFDKGTIRAEIRQSLNERGLRFQEDYLVQSKSVDFAILDAKSTPRCLVKLRDAMFYDSEARAALEELNLVERVRQSGLPASCVFVVLGYVSPEVTDTLRKFAPEYVVYNPETFPQNFSAILDRMQPLFATESFTASSGQPEPARTPINIEVSQSTAELDLIKQELQRLQASRDTEARLLDQKLEQLFQVQNLQRFNERRQAARDAWADERRKIEQQIQEARESRRQQEFNELERLREQAEKTRSRNLRTQAILTFLIGFIGLMFFFTQRFHLSYAQDSLLILGFSLIPALIYISPLLLKGFKIIESKMESDLLSPVVSLKELDQLARQYLIKVKPGFRKSESDFLMKLQRSLVPLLHFLTPPFIGRYTSRDLLEHTNPHLRYLGVLSIAPAYLSGLDDSIKRFLENALQAERSSFVRRALARKIARSPIFSGYLLEKMEDPKDAVAETAYIIEANPELLQPGSALRRHWKSLQTVDHAYRSHKAEFAVIELLPSQVSGEVAQELAIAYNAGLDRHAPAALAEINEAVIRRIIKELSPFDEGGLGTYDELQCLNLVDRLYLFFRQFLFYLERDLISQPTSTSP